MARGGKGSRQRRSEGVKYFDGSLTEYVRVQEASQTIEGKPGWWVTINLLGSARLINVPYKSYALLIQAGLISLGRDKCLSYLEGGASDSQKQAQEGPEAFEDAAEGDATGD